MISEYTRRLFQKAGYEADSMSGPVRLNHIKSGESLVLEASALCLHAKFHYRGTAINQPILYDLLESVAKERSLPLLALWFKAFTPITEPFGYRPGGGYSSTLRKAENAIFDLSNSHEYIGRFYFKDLQPDFFVRASTEYCLFRHAIEKAEENHLTLLCEEELPPSESFRYRMYGFGRLFTLHYSYKNEAERRLYDADRLTFVHLKPDDHLHDALDTFLDRMKSRQTLRTMLNESRYFFDKYTSNLSPHVNELYRDLRSRFSSEEIEKNATLYFKTRKKLLPYSFTSSRRIYYAYLPVFHLIWIFHINDNTSLLLEAGDIESLSSFLMQFGEERELEKILKLVQLMKTN